MFSSYVGSGPASTIHPPPRPPPQKKKISGISRTPINIWNFSNPQKIPLYLDLKKRPKNAYKWPLNIVQYCDDPKNYPQNLHVQKNIHFSENPKNIEIQSFEPKENDPSLRMYENISPPPPPPTHTHLPLRWAPGTQWGVLYFDIQYFIM